MAKWTNSLIFLVLISSSIIGHPFAQTIPDAPPVPSCTWDSGGIRSTCKFKDALTGTPTSVAGNRVIVFRYSKSGGEGLGRAFLDSAVERLSRRYNFTATITEDSSIFSAANLMNTKVVIMSNGDGDVLHMGENRTALENFQQVNGWGVIWIHEACAFISSGWPFGQKSCLQQYYIHNPSGTTRRMFIDSGTAGSPNHGIKNPQTEFLLRDLPGWGGKRALGMQDEWFCFRAPVRDSAGVSVLFGYDHSSGLPPSGCPDASDSSEAASQRHNMAWTHKVGNGISIFNSWGHDEDVYTGNGNMGDSLLWRYIRYAAKDWCVSGSGEPGCDGPLPIHASRTIPEPHPQLAGGTLSLFIPYAGRSTISLVDIRGKKAFSGSLNGPGRFLVPGLPRGMYFLRVNGVGDFRSYPIMVY